MVKQWQATLLVSMALVVGLHSWSIGRLEDRLEVVEAEIVELDLEVNELMVQQQADAGNLYRDLIALAEKVDGWVDWWQVFSDGCVEARWCDPKEEKK